MSKSHNEILRRGLMLVFSSPSGAGKSTISKAILGIHENLAMSISATTRPIRPGEVDGKDYIFMSNQKFDHMAKFGDFLEWEWVVWVWE